MTLYNKTGLLKKLYINSIALKNKIPKWIFDNGKWTFANGNVNSFKGNWLSAIDIHLFKILRWIVKIFK